MRNILTNATEETKFWLSRKPFLTNRGRDCEQKNREHVTFYTVVLKLANFINTFMIDKVHFHKPNDLPNSLSTFLYKKINNTF